MSEAGFYHCSVKPVGRANGRSIVAAAAYRSGERLGDERTGEVFDYRARGGVEDTFIVTAANAPAWAQDRAQLWNEAERAEPRANGRLSTEFELALPFELDAAQRRALVAGFVREIVERHGVAADVAIHSPGKDGDHRNHHAHVLITHRELGPEGFGEIANRRTVAKKVKGQEKQIEIAGIAATPADVKAIRKAWEQAENRAYEQAGLDIQVDHRSHKDRGIEAEPTKHEGPSATGMERRGAESDRGDVNREITARNAERERLAELAAQEAAVKVEIAEIMAARDAERAIERQESSAAARGPYTELKPEPEIVPVFGAAGRQTTEPAAPIFDRDQAEREWQEKLVAAAVAADAAPKPAREARQDPEPAPGTNPPAASATEPPQPRELAQEATVEAPTAGDNGLRSPEAAASGFFGHLAKVAEILGGLLFGSFMAAPKDTPAQTKQKAKAAGNLETLHAEAVTRHAATVEEEREERISRADSEQQAPLAAPGYFRTVTRPADPADRRQEQERGHERERER